MQFLLILLLLFATGYRLAKLVDAKKKKKKKMRTPGLNDNETCVDDTDDEGFNDTKASANAGFSFDSNNNHDSAVANLGSENNNNGFDNDIAISDNQTKYRQFNTLCYEDVRLLIVRNPVAGKQDMLAIKVKLAHYKKANKKPKL